LGESFLPHGENPHRAREKALWRGVDPLRPGENALSDIEHGCTVCFKDLIFFEGDERGGVFFLKGEDVHRYRV